MAAETRFFAAQAWLPGGWAHNVLLTVGADGCWSAVTPDAQPHEREGATVLSGPVLPGLVNAHSHAFQRAIAGLTERRSPGGGADDFWNWRDRMYSAAGRITPEQLEAIACHLYAELLAGGYTQVCEFQYLHNDLPGKPHAEPAEMSLALVRAAERTGMGLTLLPTLYMRSGFAASGLREDQGRFASTPASVMHTVHTVRQHSRGNPRLNAGVAIHSLRAVGIGALHELAGEAAQAGLPVHIHIAEQTQEVDDCTALTGQRPIEWLLDHADVDARWNLVHATHTTPAELQALQRSGASIVICPSTEANLGDGVFDLPGWAQAGGHWSIGSDSHATRHWPDELRLLEYSQRLMLRQRNVAARVLDAGSSAAAMLDQAIAGGNAASGLPLGGLRAGQRADFAVLDLDAPALAGVPADFLLDALVFSTPAAAFTNVHVAGRPVAPAASFQGDFVQAMQALWSAG